MICVLLWTKRTTESMILIFLRYTDVTMGCIELGIYKFELY